MSSTRRAFITIGAGSILIPFFSKIFDWGVPEKGYIIGGKSLDDFSGPKAIFMDLENKSFKYFPVDKGVHSIVQKPSEPNKFFFFCQKPRDVCTEIELLGDSYYSQAITTKQGRYFYGHGAYTRDGKKMYCTENDYKNGRSLIVVRETERFQVIDEFEQGLNSPHDMCFLNDGKTLAIANGGIKEYLGSNNHVITTPDRLISSLTLVDAETKKTKLQIVGDDHYSIRHLYKSPGGELAFISIYKGIEEDDKLKPKSYPHIPMVGILYPNNEIVYMEMIPRVIELMKFHTLSVILSVKHQFIAVSTFKGGVVTFWNSKNGKFLKTMTLAAPCGLCLSYDESYIYVTSLMGSFYSISSKTLELCGTRAEADPNINLRWSSHLLFSNHLTHA
jgi:hypothetical protein